MCHMLASHPFDSLEGIHLYFYEVGGLWVAFASMCMVVCAVQRGVKKRRAKCVRGWLS